MKNQNHLFSLPQNLHYLNGAYMSPNLKSVEKAGMEGVLRKSDPTSIKESDFFEPALEIKSLFGKLINSPASQNALIPSASYGLINALRNVPFRSGQHGIMVSEEFPSDHLALRKICQDHKADLRVIPPPVFIKGRTLTWTEDIIESITEETAVVVMSSIHWMQGLKFDLKAIGEKCRSTHTYFIVDGTQSVGALPMDVQEFNIDALICASYKWLLGPYSSGLAYYSEKFNQGEPVEYSWMTRKDSHDFDKLTSYPEDYGSGAMRYNVGEFSNFIALPMLKAGLEQILKWKVENIQSYCFELLEPLRAFQKRKGLEMEDEVNMSSHLYGLFLPESLLTPKLKDDFKTHNIHVSIRGNFIRVSPHVYNTAHDIDAFIKVLDRHV
ncbi:aminotransferase class V-fold PLP-dependent enzyme [Psychroflexus sediminis]|uniref:Selenocysteine lyase/Cysteine desulfurase n=1 Tax=Psychroflexus sediminis TaxID=470826 RepID=A0A1G7YBS1_9FLAO|nr:aminotransferase class V-fold PLP-dependent enzyme [Psychroflexus sediminis]SDG93739.1 Selenocysteine lyase/Cysteine desulfurase [Psychroflexus sediminis]